MSLYGVVTALVLSVCWWMLVLAAEEPAASKPVTPATVSGPKTAAVQPSGNHSIPATTHSTTASAKKRDFGGFSVDSSMIQRALYVLVGITLTGVLYFIIRAVRLKKPAPKKKYGLLSNYDDSVEMEGGESDEDDTLYEARGLRR